MDEAQADRIDEALSSLVELLIPVPKPKDGTGAGDTPSKALELARSIIEKYSRS
jgi:hypothetical protein